MNLQETTTQARQRSLQRLGILCGVSAALWLAAAEAPTKLVTVAVSPVIISFMMVFGAFVSRWSLPALVRGTSDLFADTKLVPHLILWGVMAGCLWAVGNTLTIFAVRDIGLSIAFPLWNSNSLIGILWGTLLFKELHGAGWLRRLGVVGGAVVIFTGAILMSAASSATAQTTHHSPAKGLAAALGAGLMFGSMYISYRKAYITGMNPLTFLTYFTFGEMGTVSLIALAYLGGGHNLWHELSANRTILIWPFLGGLMWVVGDLFQNYAAKYIGISRGIPLSNTNQLWGLLWAIFVFGELRGLSSGVYAQVIGGSLLMAAGAVAITCSSTQGNEYESWRRAALREARLYSLDKDYVMARMEGEDLSSPTLKRTWIDWAIVGVATAVFVLLGAMARVPKMELHMGWLSGLTALMFVVLFGAGWVLWRVTRFS
jgi:glucose uptake protein GlcU